jgi:hypothetical protein
MNSPPILSGVRVTRYLVLYLCFVDRCLSFCTFSSGHCVGCWKGPGSDYDKWNISNILVPCHMIDVGQVCTSYTLHIISKSQSYRHKFSAPVVCPFVLFLLAIVLAVLLQYTDSDFPFGVFILFLQAALQ